LGKAHRIHAVMKNR
jgi:hypothetical protein